MDSFAALSSKHAALEERVTNELKQMGFLIESAEYHKYMSEDIKTALILDNSVTSQYVRTRADRIAIHKDKGIAFQMEFKTHFSKRSDNMMIQALPFAIHLWNAMLGIKCLYVYEDPVSKSEKGFWADDLNRPKVKRIRFTQKRDLPKEQLYVIFSKAFPEVKRYSSDIESFGQPYAIIDYAEVCKLSHWRTLISNLIQA